MTKELGLAWRIAREPKIYGGQGGMPATIAPVTPGGEGKSDLLSLIESEVNDLAKPVSVWKVLPVETERNEGRRLLSLGDGTPLVLAQSYAGPGGTVAPLTDAAAAPAASASRGSDRGLIVYIAVAPDLEWTDLPAKPLMVPLVQEIVREGIGRAHGSWWSIAGERPATPSRSAELRAIALQGGGAGAVGDERAGLVAVNELGLTSVPLRRAGLWRAADERGAARGVVAVNPDTRGSRTQAQETASLEQWLGRAAFDGKVVWVGDAERTAAAGTPEGNTVGSLAELLARESSGSPISLPLLIAALCVAVFELWLARFASHAGVPVVTSRRKGVAA